MVGMEGRTRPVLQVRSLRPARQPHQMGRDTQAHQQQHPAHPVQMGRHQIERTGAQGKPQQDQGENDRVQGQPQPGPVAPQHYAFLVGDAEFDAGMARIADKGLAYWADPARQHAGEINRHWGGRGIYFEDPDGHFLEMITKPYGSEKDL